MFVSVKTDPPKGFNTSHNDIKVKISQKLTINFDYLTKLFK